MRNVAIIPARGDSKRLPEKNLRLLGGIPLVAHSILYAKANSAFIDAIYVTTDDARIAEIATAYGAEIIHRPAELATDEAPTVTALKHALGQMPDFDNVVLLQPTNPLRPEGLLADALKIFNDSQCQSLFTVTRNHQKFGSIENDRFIPFNYRPGQRSQDLAPLYFENGLLYLTKAKQIMDEVIMTEDAFPMIVEHPYAAVDIDTQQDFDYAAFLMKQ
jgi:N-acylneuraminate cytidylyltransferase